jgi:hypothetical protein
MYFTLRIGHGLKLPHVLFVQSCPLSSGYSPPSLDLQEAHKEPFQSENQHLDLKRQRKEVMMLTELYGLILKNAFHQSSRAGCKLIKSSLHISKGPELIEILPFQKYTKIGHLLFITL